MRGMSSMFGDSDGGQNTFFSDIPSSGSQGRRTSFRSSSPTPPGGSSQPSEITRPLKLSLEELYSGATKRLKVSRRLLSGATEDKVLEIEVQPGWKSGTKIRFPRAGNEQRGGESQDLVFVVEEKPHAVFQREENDLVCHIEIPLVDALTGGSGKKTVEALDGRKLQISFPAGIVRPGQQNIVVGEGMPIRKDGASRAKGDLRVTWDTVFPDRLTSAQKEGLRKVLG
jgi:DnaJ family protein B protein 4